MHFLDTLIAPSKAFSLGKLSKASTQTSVPEHTSGTTRWMKLSRSFTGRRKPQDSQRRNSMEEFGQRSWSPMKDTLPALLEKAYVSEPTGTERPLKLPAKDESAVPLLYRDFSQIPSEESDSDYTDDHTLYADCSTNKEFTSKSPDCSGVILEPALSTITVKRVEPIVITEDEYVHQMLSSPHVFIPKNPYIYDGPMIEKIKDQ